MLNTAFTYLNVIFLDYINTNKTEGIEGVFKREMNNKSNANFLRNSFLVIQHTIIPVRFSMVESSLKLLF